MCVCYGAEVRVTTPTGRSLVMKNSDLQQSHDCKGENNGYRVTQYCNFSDLVLIVPPIAITYNLLHIYSKVKNTSAISMVPLLCPLFGGSTLYIIIVCI